MKDGIKHFLFVGVGFALVAGWILTLIVNTLLEMLLQAILGAPPTDFYLGSLFLTVVSISLIAVCEIGGNRLFRSRLVSPGFGFSSIVASTLFFIVLVLAFVLPEFSQVIRRCADNAPIFLSTQFGTLPDAIAPSGTARDPARGTFLCRSRRALQRHQHLTRQCSHGEVEG